MRGARASLRGRIEVTKTQMTQGMRLAARRSSLGNDDSRRQRNARVREPSTTHPSRGTGYRRGKGLVPSSKAWQIKLKGRAGRRRAGVTA